MRYVFRRDCHVNIDHRRTFVKRNTEAYGRIVGESAILRIAFSGKQCCTQRRKVRCKPVAPPQSDGVGDSESDGTTQSEMSTSRIDMLEEVTPRKGQCRIPQWSSDWMTPLALVVWLISTLGIAWDMCWNSAVANAWMSGLGRDASLEGLRVLVNPVYRVYYVIQAWMRVITQKPAVAAIILPATLNAPAYPWLLEQILAHCHSFRIGTQPYVFRCKQCRELHEGRKSPFGVIVAIWPPEVMVDIAPFLASSPVTPKPTIPTPPQPAPTAGLYIGLSAREGFGLFAGQYLPRRWRWINRIFRDVVKERTRWGIEPFSRAYRIEPTSVPPGGCEMLFRVNSVTRRGGWRVSHVKENALLQIDGDWLVLTTLRRVCPGEEILASYRWGGDTAILLEVGDDC